MKLCLLKIAIRREKFDQKSQRKWGRLRDPKFARTIGLIFSDVTGLYTARPGPGVLYCSVLFSDTIDRAENFNFKKNGGKYSRTEF